VNGLERMLAMRGYMRAKTIDGVIDEGIASRVGMTPQQIEDMYHVMAIANYEDRFVIPTSHRELGEDAYDLRGSCGFSFGNGCAGGEQQNLFSINDKFVVRIQVMQWPALLRGMYASLLPTFQIGWLADYPDAHNFVFPFMHSAGTFSSWQNYNNPTVDALIAQAISSASSAERESLYRQLDQIYYDECPSVQEAQPLGRRYFRDWITGFYFNPVIPGNSGNLYALHKGY